MKQQACQRCQQPCCLLPAAVRCLLPSRGGGHDCTVGQAGRQAGGGADGSGVVRGRHGGVWEGNQAAVSRPEPEAGKRAGRTAARWAGWRAGRRACGWAGGWACWRSMAARQHCRSWDSRSPAGCEADTLPATTASTLGRWLQATAPLHGVHGLRRSEAREHAGCLPCTPLSHQIPTCTAPCCAHVPLDVAAQAVVAAGQLTDLPGAAEDRGPVQGSVRVCVRAA